MFNGTQPTVSPADLLRILKTHRRFWVIPAVLGGLLAASFALLATRPWQATQTLVVRNEALNSQDGPGRFRQEDEMKTTQETIMAVAHSAGVLSKALTEVGAPSDYANPKSWPTADDVAGLQEAMEISPPKGAEFGKTEIFYLSVKDASRDRALALVKAVCRQMQNGMGEVRDAKTAGLISELSKAVDVAKADLNEVTAELSKMERRVGGSDLADLRMLDQTAAGDSDLRRKLTSIELELREARIARLGIDELLASLNAAKKDAGYLLATPNRLLESQPALRRLKDGLVDAQLRTAQLRGTMSAKHPQVQAAVSSEEEISRDIHSELEIALRGVRVEMRLADGRIHLLDGQLTETRNRLDLLAGLRAEYSNVAAAARHRNALLEKASRELAEARGSRAGASIASLISPIDQPTTGARPIGPSRVLTTLAGVMGGMVLGFGYLFLTLQPAAPIQAHQNGKASHNGRSAVRPAMAAASVLSLNQALQRVWVRVPRF